MMGFRILLVFFCTVMALGLFADKKRMVFYKKGDLLYVGAVQGLDLKESPSAEAKKVQTIDYGSQIKVSALNDTQMTLENINGYWVQVTYNGKAGYVFDGFLCRLPLPDLKVSLGIEKYAQKYLGKGKQTLEDTVEYKGGYVVKTVSVDGYHGSELTIPKITLNEAFLLARAVAIPLEMGFSEKDLFPLKSSTYAESYQGKNLNVETKYEVIDGKTYVSLSKGWEDGHIFVFGLEKENNSDSVKIYIGSAD